MKISKISRSKLKWSFKLIKTFKLKKLFSLDINFNGKSFPIYFRTQSRGDIGVLKQIFLNQDYKLASWVQGRALIQYYEKVANYKTPVIIDAGANIGASCLFFNSLFPNSKIIAIEPAPTNISLLEKNIANMNATILRGALTYAEAMYLHDPNLSDWGFQVKESGEIKVECYNPEQVLSTLSGSEVPLIFKIDIEGSEKDIFPEGADWVASIPLLIIEIHDWMLPGKGTAHPFFKAILKHDFDILIRGENVFCFNNAILKEFY